MPKYANSVSYAGRRANSDHSGQARFATDEQVVDGSSDELIVSPSGLQAVIDTDSTFASASDTLIPSQLAVKTYADSLAIAGAPAWSESVSGIGQLSTAVEAVAVTNDTTAMTPLKVGQVFAAPPAIGSGTPAAGAFTTLSTTGLASLGASATIVTGAVALNLGADAAAGAINVGTGAAARVITVGNVTGATQVVVNSGTAGTVITSTGAGDITLNGGDKITLDAAGTVDINSSAAAINIANDDVDQAVNIATDGERTLTIGSANGAAGVVIQQGTGGCSIANNAIAGNVTLGNKTGATALALEVGTGNFTLDGVAATTYTVGASTTTGTISIGGTAQTGTITIGDSSGINIVQIGSGEGATTVNIAGGATAAKVVNVATGAVANLVTIGSASGAASLDLKCGTGNFTLEGATTSTYEISSTGANTGTCKFASGTGARTVEIGGGGTGIKTINIGAAATADVITIGTTTGAGTTTIAAGSGSIVHAGPCSYTPDSITATSDGVAASVATVVTLITTNGDSDEDNVTLADGIAGQVKIFAVIAAGNAADSVKITPANMAGGTQITFAADPTGLGCHMVFDGTNWCVTSNNGGTIA